MDNVKKDFFCWIYKSKSKSPRTKKKKRKPIIKENQKLRTRQETCNNACLSLYRNIGDTRLKRPRAEHRKEARKTNLPQMNSRDNRHPEKILSFRSNQMPKESQSENIVEAF